MAELAVERLPSGESAFALALDSLVPSPSLTPEAITGEMVALVTALQGERQGRVVLQIAAYPQQRSPQPGALRVHLIGVVTPEGSDDVGRHVTAQAEDLRDLLAAPPLRWLFRNVSDPSELSEVLRPVGCTHVVEIGRREEPAPPTSVDRVVGFRHGPANELIGDPLWNVWTLGPASADMRRLAGVMLNQSAPVVVRVSLTPARLSERERLDLEQLVMLASEEPASGGRRHAALVTLESLLYVRPLFEVQCLVASSEPLSRALVSAVGHSVSIPAPHGSAGGVLAGGFAVIREGVEVEKGSLLADYEALGPTSPPPSLAPASLRRLRRLVGAWEAANVFRLPFATDEVFPGLERFDLPDLDVPPAGFTPDGARLGRLVGQFDSPVTLDTEDRMRHLYVSGQTGTGKSSLLFNLVLQDIERGAGVAVLDPHGDLVEALLACIPDDRIDDVVLIDPSDPVAVVGVNLLQAESSAQHQFLVSELCAMFYALYDPKRQGIIGPRWESMLRGAAGLLLANEQQPSSLLDVTTVFADSAVREHLLEGVTDPLLLEFWLGEVANNRSNDFGEMVAWFRSKFEPFRTSPLVRNMIGQGRSTVSFNEILDQQRIVLINLSKGLLGEYNSALLGQVVFIKLWGAALERASKPHADRKDFFVYIDEFQNMTTDSLPDVLSEARKFRLGLTLANQFFTQVPDMTRDAIMGNVGARVTFRVGPKDAESFTGWLGGRVSPSDLTRLPNYHGIASLSNRGVPIDPFVLRTDSPRSSTDLERAALVRERSRERWARPVSELDADFFGRWAHVKGSLAEAAGVKVLKETRSNRNASADRFAAGWEHRRMLRKVSQVAAVEASGDGGGAENGSDEQAPGVVVEAFSIVPLRQEWFDAARLGEMSVDVRPDFERYFGEVLEHRIATRLLEVMSPSLHRKWMGIVRQGASGAARRDWLRTNVSTVGEIIEAEITKILGDVIWSASRLVKVT